MTTTTISTVAGYALFWIIATALCLALNLAGVMPWITKLLEGRGQHL